MYAGADTVPESITLHFPTAEGYHTKFCKCVKMVWAQIKGEQILPLGPLWVAVWLVPENSPSQGIKDRLPKGLKIFSLCLTGLFFSGDYSRLSRVPNRSSEDESLGIAGSRFFCQLDALAVTQPTVSKHWRNRGHRGKFRSCCERAYRICRNTDIRREKLAALMTYHDRTLVTRW